MTEEEIIKALECCVKVDACQECPYGAACLDDKYVSIIAKDALDLINRQKAEIERLKGECDSKEKAHTAEYILRKELKAEIARLKDDKNRLEKMMDNLSKELDAEKIKNF